ncbi:MAG: MotE family protein [Fibrobacterota bacterium]
MRKREIVIVSFFIILFSFPLIYLGMLIGTGNAKIVFKGDMARKIEVENQARLQRESEERDSILSKNSRAFLAKERELKRIKKEREKLIREQERLENLKAELTQERKKLARKQEKLEEIVEKNDEAHEERLKKLAAVYQAMDAEAAARIMETLSDDLCIDIFDKMNEVRQKAEILSVMNGEKASRLSKKMGINISE